ncbi:hypothetical protein L7F22_007045 [Adiantum nelumboides]|nr:hypothetical protein [Adiantum nelumboides]
MQHAVTHLQPATSLHLLRRTAACSRFFLRATYTTCRSPTSSSSHHHRNLGDNPPPYSLQPTSAQRHDSMADSGAASQQSLKPIDHVTKRYDDMHESYGEGYATRSSEEGFGGIYSSPVSSKGRKMKGAHHESGTEEDDLPGAEPAQEFDHTQGSHVAEKEPSRHGAGFTGAPPS